MEGYADCKEELVDTEYLNVDGAETIEFIPQVCREDGTQELEQDVEEPECVTKPTWQCDSVWVVDGHGAREEKQENCREEEIEDCKLVKKSVVTSYPKYHCEADTPIKYVRPIYDGRNVNRYSRRCEAKALPVCHPKLEAR